MDVRISETALDTLEAIETERKKRIVDKITDAAEVPDHYLDGLTDFPGYKLRVGDYRVILDWDKREDVLYVVAVLERKDEYRELPSLREEWGTWRE